MDQRYNSRYLAYLFEYNRKDLKTYPFLAPKEPLYNNLLSVQWIPFELPVDDFTSSLIWVGIGILAFLLYEYILNSELKNSRRSNRYYYFSWNQIGNNLTDLY